MSAELLHRYIEEVRSPADYLHLLIDPLAGCIDDHPLSAFRLKEALGEEALAIVPRADLVHAPQECPLVVTLARPGHPFDGERFAATHAYAAEASPGGKRYICGWIIAGEDATSVARHLANRCRVNDSEQVRIWPMFEPLRMELLAGSLNHDIGRWLWPIKECVLPSSSGRVFRLRGAHGDGPPAWSTEALGAQHDAPAVAAVLVAWQRLSSQPMSPGLLQQAPRHWAGPGLPEGAAAKALHHLREARRLGLPPGEDRIVFALHSLTVHPHWDTHPQLRPHIVQALASKTPLADALARIEDWTWQRALHELTAEPGG
ncbi:hypothetical protein ABE485_04970 [Achromobacter spanius]|uniref:hypothetical protein n=1 Tax=Achromobacter spanius TaxID=217203 RepID=UPI0032086B0F